MKQSTSNEEYQEKDESLLRKSFLTRAPMMVGKLSTKRAASGISFALLISVGLLSTYKFTGAYQRTLLPMYENLLVLKDGKDLLGLNNKSQPLVSDLYLRDSLQYRQLVSGEEAFKFLRLIADRELVTYNSNIDLLIFDHPMKTGGTSVSDALKEVFHEQVIPGSDRSDYFNYQKARRSMEQARQNRTLAQWLSQQKAIYSHTSMYDNQGQPSKFSLFLQSTFPDTRRFRILTMVSKRIVIQ
jgi:hypothetical protein